MVEQLSIVSSNEKTKQFFFVNGNVMKTNKDNLLDQFFTVKVYYYQFSVVTVSLAKNRECGKRWIYNEKADFYLSSTFFDSIRPVYSFGEVKYKSGIAIILLTQDKKMRDKPTSINNQCRLETICNTCNKFLLPPWKIKCISIVK